MSISKISLIDFNDTKLRKDDSAKTISFFCKIRPVKIDSSVVSELRDISEQNKGENVRICLHDSPLSKHHDMVILERKGKYYRPHKHKDKGEAFHIIDGKMAIFIFDEDGSIVDSTVLLQGDIYRIEENQYHSVMPVTNIVIYHENKPGPFLGDKDSVFPSWAPDGNDYNKTQNYISYLNSYIK
jgi:glucose-6-phosphate isomerase